MSARSAPVSTQTTPGIFSAAEVSIETMRPCATGLRSTLPCSIRGTTQVADELRLPAGLLARVAARHRAADLRAGLGDGRRHLAASSATASTMPR